MAKRASACFARCIRTLPRGRDATTEGMVWRLRYDGVAHGVGNIEGKGRGRRV